MDSSFTICVYCGAEHAATEDRCPSCGRQSVDERLVPATPAETDVETPAEAIVTNPTESDLLGESDHDEPAAGAETGGPLETPDHDAPPSEMTDDPFELVLWDPADDDPLAGLEIGDEITMPGLEMVRTLDEAERTTDAAIPIADLSDGELTEFDLPELDLPDVETSTLIPEEAMISEEDVALGDIAQAGMTNDEATFSELDIATNDAAVPTNDLVDEVAGNVDEYTEDMPSVEDVVDETWLDEPSGAAPVSASSDPSWDDTWLEDAWVDDDVATTDDQTAVISAGQFGATPTETLSDATIDGEADLAAVVPLEMTPAHIEVVPDVPVADMPVPEITQDQPQPAATAAGATLDPTAEVARGSGGPPPSSRSQTLIIGLVVLSVIIGWFLVLTWISREDSNIGDLAVDAPVVVSSTETPATDAATTESPDTDAPQNTEPPAASTAPPQTEPPVAAAVVPDIAAVGDPIAVTDLGLGAFALGPLNVGDNDVLGRLVSTFGPPDTYEAMTGSFGICEGVEGFTTSWGPLTGIFEGTADVNTFAGYRVTEDGGDHPAAALTTLSGLKAGDTVGQLETVYGGFVITYEDGQFILTRGSDGVTLLWGPVSDSTESGIVLGIHSPSGCDGGPVPTP